MRFIAKIAEVSKTSKADYIVLEGKDLHIKFARLLESTQEFELVEQKEKRTKDANAYMWVLLGKLQSYLNIPKEEIYKEYIRRMGIYTVVPVEEQAIEKFKETWQGQGLGNICEVVDSVIDGYKNVLAYSGTSTYSRKEMAQLLDEIIADCKEYKIETEPQEYVDSLLQNWEGD